ncbi:bifunctional 3,4-dihydroxy-2-butanone-4-phosphate synthase/GTP cyclohydrolase II [Pyrococcus furiosus DSM 3638]|nr:bifunctional 3,4-dihydroxy-2-butanone-4-phosphate synthase/GTP cyclohydrolase II [Pyrococcus furiosus]AFN04509.1 bifunctional 3,4-dihydroxy-2-butanone 4-phosphate synthase/GTP cyclohydrolase II protein [Pyrococcus furiosus COM1]QEK77799.1 bifunctional 3,4-dihydroxy-2-butanone-4-phosphate synthase/GTP cyclohydrolase II [Pyrococcus furiosus DSM 3638]
MNIEEIRNSFLSGRPAVLIDEERENEADLVFPAEIATPKVVNFMLSAKGLLCLALDMEEGIKRGFFKLPNNGGETNFLIPVDYKDVFTGITAEERALTARKVAEGLGIENFRYPGHLPLLGGLGLNKRKGHTEASLELVEMAGFKRYALIIEILDDKGYSHNLDYAFHFAKEHDLPLIRIREIWKEFVRRKQLIHVYSKAKLPTKYGDFEIYSFKNDLDFKDHVALVKKPFKGTPLVRVHSKCLTGDTLGSLKCDCGSQLENALRTISQEGGVLIYLDQEGRGIGLREKIRAYEFQDRGLDTVEANKALGFAPDERTYEVAFQILRALGIEKIKLLTNNPSKVKALRELGIEIEDVIPLPGEINRYNFFYLKTKVEKLGHKIPGVEV